MSSFDSDSDSDSQYEDAYEVPIETTKNKETEVFNDELKYKYENKSNYYNDYNEENNNNTNVVESKDNDIIKDLSIALQYKEDGNNLFKSQLYAQAVSSYGLAISSCPVDGVDSEGVRYLSIFYGNRATAHYYLDNYSEAVDDCNEALAINKYYLKALIRRSLALEKLDRLEDALADLKSIKEIEPNYPNINQNINRLEKLSAERMEKLKTEAFDKLKDLGNAILGNFGMSVNDFKMAQDPKTGSWSIG